MNFSFVILSEFQTNEVERKNNNKIWSRYLLLIPNRLEPQEDLKVGYFTPFC